jgi:hypothetical protein
MQLIFTFDKSFRLSIDDPRVKRDGDMSMAVGGEADRFALTLALGRHRMEQNIPRERTRSFVQRRRVERRWSVDT